MERALAARLHDPRVDETLQVMAEGRCGQFDMPLNRAGRGALRSGLDDEAEDGEADGMAQGAKLLRMMVQLGGQYVTSKSFEVDRQASRLAPQERDDAPLRLRPASRSARHNRARCARAARMSAGRASAARRTES